MNIRTIGALAALALLTACVENKPQTDGTTLSGGGAVVSTAGIVPGSEEDLRTNIGDRVLFAFDRSVITADGRATLDKQAAWLGKYSDVNVQILGNCDERGTEEYNVVLGQRRASAARAYLLAKGIAPARVTTISFGKDRPTAVGSTEAAWQQNRNATTEVR